MDIRQGDCRELMAAMEPASVDAIVTDPPYGLAFMGKEWDHGVPGVPFWTEALRVAKPGAHLVAFGGTRTYHRLACALEDAGWEIRDCLSWLYGSGFPKSKNLDGDWDGWGTALKPAWEPVILARKPLAGTVAANVLEHGTGALNVDGCRIETTDGYAENAVTQGVNTARTSFAPAVAPRTFAPSQVGRWPANVVLDEEAAAMLDEQSGEQRDGIAVQRNRDGEVHNEVFGAYKKPAVPDVGFGGFGGASRFFYTAKASSGERHYAGKNTHPTVKPVDLMRWLCRLVTPPGGLILDPFCGSGSTGVAALAEGFRFVGCELNPEYVAMARRRIAGPLFSEASRG